MTFGQYSFSFQSLSIYTWSLFPDAMLSYGIKDVAFVKWSNKTIFLFCLSYCYNSKVWKITVNFVENM